MKPSGYADIGHNEPDDMIWMERDGEIKARQRSSNQQEKNGDKYFAGDVWHGRYEPKTGFCSIVPPVDEAGADAPAELLKKLKARFIITKCYLFQFFGEVKEIKLQKKK